MIIYSKNSIFTYDAETSFDLLNPPKNDKYIASYNKFINHVLYIYGQIKTDGSIPVFFTKAMESGTQRQADRNSTLTALEPNKTYYIVLSSDEILPLTIPTNITSEEFLSTYYCHNDDRCDNVDICNKSLYIVKKDHHNISLTGNYTYDINLTVSNLYSSNQYYYEIEPVYSNWPARISSQSGFISIPSNNMDNLGYTSGTIKSFFSYYPSGENYENSIPYDNNIDISSNFYYKNIFSILNLSIYSNNMDLLFTDYINIKCDSCLPNKNRKNPIFKLSNTAGSFDKINQIDCSGSVPIYINYSGLDPSKTYSFGFGSVNGNWPARILPKIKNLVPEYLYEDPESNMVYGTGTVVANFSFSPVYNPFPSWPNLQYNLESFAKEKFVDDNIYNILSLSVSESSNNLYKESIIIKGNIESNNENCINSLYIKFDNTSNTYPSGGLTETSRPGSEINLTDKLCCNKDQILTATISGACCGKEYGYRFYNSNQYTSITPLSGTISFGNGVGKIGAVYNLNNRPATTVRLVIFDTTDNTYAVDNIILRCPNKIPILP